MIRKYCIAVLMFAVLGALAYAGVPQKSELTFAATLFNPSEGDTVWSGTGEMLFPIAGNFIAGPSVSLFDLGPVDGGSFGVAGELGVGKTSGLFVGAAVNKLTGDAADAADYTGQARFGVKFGGQHGFVKVYASQTWSQNEAGNRTDPDGTAFNAGLGLRF